MLFLRRKGCSTHHHFSAHTKISRVLDSRRRSSPPPGSHVSVHGSRHRPVCTDGLPTLKEAMVRKTKGDHNRKRKAEELWILPRLFLMIAPPVLPGGLMFGARAASVRITYRAALCSAAQSSRRETTCRSG